MKQISKAILTAVLCWAASLVQSARIAPAVTAQQERLSVGAFDATHGNGLVFVAPEQNIFGLRVLSFRPGASVEDTPRQYEFGPQTADGSYARIAWRTRFDDKTPVLLRWSRVSSRVVIGRITAPANVRLALETYRPWSEAQNEHNRTIFSAQTDRRTILGEQIHAQKTKPPLRHFLLRTDRAANGAASYLTAAELRTALTKEGHAQTAARETADLARHAALSFDLNPAAAIGFVALVGDDFAELEAEAEKWLQRPLLEQLDQAEKKADAAQPASGGSLGNSLEGLSRLLLWNRLYDARQQHEYVALQRQPGRALRGDALSWDSLLTALAGSVFDAASAKATLRSVLEGQTPDGRIPLRRALQTPAAGEPATLNGRSMPPLGALCVWKVYLATHDLELLAWSYPRLQRWNDWWFTNRGDGQVWRDGNSDGLLEWGFDAELEYGALGAKNLVAAAKRKLAFSESGLPIRPQWLPTEPGAAGTATAPPDGVNFNDKTHTLELAPVALNSLYALDTEMMMLISRELGLNGEAARWEFRYGELKKLINQKLWNEEAGAYLNRHWDGRFSPYLSLENFLPLVAGIPDDERAQQMLATLRNAQKSWGEQLAATGAGETGAPGAEHIGRGAVWAPLNYLFYLGLKRHGLHAEAAELARKSTAVARPAWEKQGKYFDLFSGLDGRGWDDNELRTSFAGLMFWPSVEELISADPWSGLTLGNLGATEETRVDHLHYDGSNVDVLVNPQRTVIRRDGKLDVEVEGLAILRGYRVNERTLIFVIEAKEQVRLLIPSSENRKITVSLDEKVIGSTSAGAAASFKIASGLHKVLVVK